MNDIKARILSLVLSLPALLIALTVHEFAHGFAADKMGDRTARYSGRLSLNPLDHMDLVGTLCLLFLHFGWAKPVPINPRNFRKPKLGIIVVSLAGPFANFILAIIASFGLVAMRIYAPVNTITVFFMNIIEPCIYMNIGLMIFNLIPIPPLDGSKILMEFLPNKYKFQIYAYERYISLGLMLLVFSGVLTPVLGYLSGWVIDFINLLLGLVF